jgi:hypothetical protein
VPQTVPGKRGSVGVLSFDVDDMAVELLKKLAIALPDFLALTAQIERRHEKFPPPGGVLWISPYITLPKRCSLARVVYACAPEASDQTMTPGPNPRKSIGWRSLGESNPCFSLERTTANQAGVLGMLHPIGRCGSEFLFLIK